MTGLKYIMSTKEKKRRTQALKISPPKFSLLFRCENRANIIIVFFLEGEGMCADRRFKGENWVQSRETNFRSHLHTLFHVLVHVLQHISLIQSNPIQLSLPLTQICMLINICESCAQEFRVLSKYYELKFFFK